MWQEETFDPVTIDRELSWVTSFGMNAVRVFLHHLLWVQDSDGFLKKIEKFLQIADSYKIRTVLVFFDDVWAPTAKLGQQPEPEPRKYKKHFFLTNSHKILTNFFHAVKPPYLQCSCSERPAKFMDLDIK